MTCIVGIRHPAGVLLAADSCGANSWTYSIRRDPKLGLVGAYGIGYTTSFRMGQLLLCGFTPPAPPRRQSAIFAFMATEFVDALRKRLGDGGFAKKDNGREEGGNFLVATRGRLFEIGADFQVGEHVDPFAAVGSGEQSALGALHVLDKRVAPRRRAARALRAASRVASTVRAPWRFLEVPR